MFDNDDKDLIDKIAICNKHINNHDTVYCIGDFATNPISAKRALYSLQGKWVFLTGYHDHSLNVIKYVEGVEIADNSIIKLGSYEAVLSYFCLLDWYGKDYGVNLFYGKKIDEKIAPKNSLCVDWSIWNRPMDINDLLDIIKLKNEVDI